MTLAAGARFGRYEITGTLGAGGMGEVYRATDTTLGREVAIKTLPAALADDPERLARFEREAQLLAALNHPHIATIYGLDSHDGARYLAMELVEGQTLEEQLKAGALPVEDALRLALQIAEALEAAHGKGVVHRDLKPANVMVTAGAQIKVLDFGLAKAFSSEAAGAPQNSPALSLAMTQAGLILGTAGYMSPEQASSQAVDQRADIWAFGVLVYEMLTGLPLFRGESVPHILADVLRAEPDWRRLPKDLHPRIRLMLERCLEKKPRNRYHAIADARIDIEKALGDPLGVTPAKTSMTPVSARAVWSRMAASAVLTAAVVGSAAWLLRPTPAIDPPVRLSIVHRGAGNFGGNETDANVAISPDGRHIAYVASDSGQNSALQPLFVRALDEFEPTLLSTSARTPFFSPDGQWIGFVEENRRLSRVSTSGGPVIGIGGDANATRGATWGGDGSIIFSVGLSSSGLKRIRAGGGDVETLSTPNTEAGELEHVFPHYLPGAQAVLFTIVKGTGTSRMQVAVLDLETREYRVLIDGAGDPRYSPSGHIVFGIDGTLRAVPFDIGRLEVTGEAVPVLDNVVTLPTGAAAFDVATNGSLVYLEGPTLGGETSLVWVDSEGREEPIDVPSPAHKVGPVLSPDGSRLAITVPGDSAGGLDIWIWSFGAQTLTRLTSSPADDLGALWTPDSTEILYYTAGAGLFRRRADGAGTPMQLLESADLITPYAWTADGQLLVTRRLGARDMDIAMLSPEGNGQLTQLVNTPGQDNYPAVSPDGRWLAYTSSESGMSEVYVRPLPEVDAGRWQISSGGGREPKWSGDGLTLYYRGTAEAMMAADVTAEPEFAWTPPRAVLDVENYAFLDNAQTYDVGVDGRFLLVRSAGSEDEAQLNVVLNWAEDLRRLVPTD